MQNQNFRKSLYFTFRESRICFQNTDNGIGVDSYSPSSGHEVDPVAPSSNNNNNVLPAVEGNDFFESVDSVEDLNDAITHGAITHWQKIDDLRRELMLSKNDVIQFLEWRVDANNENNFSKNVLTESDILRACSPRVITLNLSNSNLDPLELKNYNNNFQKTVRGFYNALRNANISQNFKKSQTLGKKLKSLDYSFEFVPGSTHIVRGLMLPNSIFGMAGKVNGSLHENNGDIFLTTKIDNKEFVINLTTPQKVLPPPPFKSFFVNYNGEIVFNSGDNVSAQEFNDWSSLKARWNSISSETRVGILIDRIADLDGDKSISTDKIRKEGSSVLFGLIQWGRDSLNERDLTGADPNIALDQQTLENNPETQKALDYGLTEKSIRTTLLRLTQNVNSSLFFKQLGLDVDSLPESVDAFQKNITFARNYLYEHAPLKLARDQGVTLEDNLRVPKSGEIQQKVSEIVANFSEQDLSLATIPFGNMVDQKLKTIKDFIMRESIKVEILRRFILAQNIRKLIDRIPASNQIVVRGDEIKTNVILDAFKENKLEQLVLKIKVPELSIRALKITPNQGPSVVFSFDKLKTTVKTIQINNQIVVTNTITIQDPGSVNHVNVIRYYNIDGSLHHTDVTPSGVEIIPGNKTEVSRQETTTTTTTTATHESKFRFLGLDYSEPIATTSLSTPLPGDHNAVFIGGFHIGTRGLTTGVSAVVGGTRSVGPLEFGYDVTGNLATQTLKATPGSPATSVSAGSSLAMPVGTYDKVYVRAAVTALPAGVLETLAVGIQSDAERRLGDYIANDIEINFDRWGVEKNLIGNNNIELLTNLKQFSKSLTPNLSDTDPDFVRNALDKYFFARGQYLKKMFLPPALFGGAEISLNRLSNVIFVGVGIRLLIPRIVANAIGSSEIGYNKSRDVTTVVAANSLQANDVRQLFSGIGILLLPDCSASDGDYQSFELDPLTSTLDQKFVFRLDPGLDEGNIKLIERDGKVILKVKNGANFPLHLWQHIHTHALNHAFDETRVITLSRFLVDDPTKIPVAKEIKLVRYGQGGRASRASEEPSGYTSLEIQSYVEKTKIVEVAMLTRIAEGVAVNAHFIDDCHSSISKLPATEAATLLASLASDYSASLASNLQALKNKFFSASASPSQKATFELILRDRLSQEGSLLPESLGNIVESFKKLDKCAKDKVVVQISKNEIPDDLFKLKQWGQLSNSERQVVLFQLVASNLMVVKDPGDNKRAKHYAQIFKNVMEKSVEHHWFSTNTDEANKKLITNSLSMKGGVATLIASKNVIVQMGSSTQADPKVHFLQNYQVQEKDQLDVFNYKIISDANLWLSTIPQSLIIKRAQHIYDMAAATLGNNPNVQLVSFSGSDVIASFKESVLNQLPFKIAKLQYQVDDRWVPSNSALTADVKFSPNVGTGFLKQLNSKNACDNPVVISAPPSISQPKINLPTIQSDPSHALSQSRGATNVGSNYNVAGQVINIGVMLSSPTSEATQQNETTTIATKEDIITVPGSSTTETHYRDVIVPGCEDGSGVVIIPSDTSGVVTGNF